MIRWVLIDHWFTVRSSLIMITSSGLGIELGIEAEAEMLFYGLSAAECLSQHVTIFFQSLISID